VYALPRWSCCTRSVITSPRSSAVGEYCCCWYMTRVFWSKYTFPTCPFCVRICTICRCASTPCTSPETSLAFAPVPAPAPPWLSTPPTMSPSAPACAHPVAETTSAIITIPLHMAFMDDLLPGFRPLRVHGRASAVPSNTY
jgi:hypothetical protein